MIIRIGRAVWPWLLPVTLIVGYFFWTESGHQMYFPPISEVVSSFIDRWTGDQFTENVVPSLTNLSLGFSVGFTLGIALGIAVGRVPWLRHFVTPIVAFNLTLPPVALLPLFLIVLGIGQQLQVGIIAFSVFFYVFVTTADAIRSIDPIVLDVGAVYRLSPARRLVSIYIPSAVPAIIAAARVTLATGLLVMVVSEMVGASRGIGAVILLAQQSFAYDDLWAGMVLVAGLGIALNVVFEFVERVILELTGYIPVHQKGKS